MSQRVIVANFESVVGSKMQVESVGSQVARTHTQHTYTHTHAGDPTTRGRCGAARPTRRTTNGACTACGSQVLGWCAGLAGGKWRQSHVQFIGRRIGGDNRPQGGRRGMLCEHQVMLYCGNHERRGGARAIERDRKTSRYIHAD